MPRSKSSTRWLQEHFSDPYVKKAQNENYRSRAVYKLKEINEKEHLLHKGMTIIDLGAAPGSWAQYTSKILNGTGKIIALDLLPITAIKDVITIQGDFREDEILQIISTHIPATGVDIIFSDLAPNMSGTAAIDIPSAMYLAELAFDLAKQVLKLNGTILMKVLHGNGFDTLLKCARLLFKKVTIHKPIASRARSRETYLLAQGYNL